VQAPLSAHTADGWCMNGPVPTTSLTGNGPRRIAFQCFVGASPMTWLTSGSSAPLHSQGMPAPHWQPNSSDHAI
jgi:hypothetical protein